MRRTIVTVAATGVLLSGGVALAGSAAAAGGTGGKCHYEYAADGQTITSIACTGGTGHGDGTGGGGGRYVNDQQGGGFNYSYGSGLGTGGEYYSPGGGGHHTVVTFDPLTYKNVGGGSPQP
jgi:hypothetical protein